MTNIQQNIISIITGLATSSVIWIIFFDIPQSSWLLILNIIDFNTWTGILIWIPVASLVKRKLKNIYNTKQEQKN